QPPEFNVDFKYDWEEDEGAPLSVRGEAALEDGWKPNERPPHIYCSVEMKVWAGPESFIATESVVGDDVDGTLLQFCGCLRRAIRTKQKVYLHQDQIPSDLSFQVVGTAMVVTTSQ